MNDWDTRHRDGREESLPASKCLEYRRSDGNDCEGDVEYRMSLSGTGTPIPRCDKHWDERLVQNDKHKAIYPDSPIAPAWFDPAAAGEHWDNDY